MNPKGNQPKRDSKDLGPRINNQIRAREVRLIGAEGEQLGIFILSEAISRAEADGFDLVEISPNAEPPVCRIMDYGKFKYQKQKREHEAKKKQAVVHLKEVKFRPKIKDRDLEVKVNHAKKFLEHGDKVKITVVFSRREMDHPEIGHAVLAKIRAMIANDCIIENEPKMESKLIIMMLAPLPKKDREKKEKIKLEQERDEEEMQDNDDDIDSDTDSESLSENE